MDAAGEQGEHAEQHMSLQQLGAEYRTLCATRPGHFGSESGGAWDADVDAYGGRKHRVLERIRDELNAAAARGAALTRAAVEQLLGPAQRTCPPSDAIWRAVEREHGARADTATVLLYAWRGMHDVLCVACAADGTVLTAQFWMAGE